MDKFMLSELRDRAHFVAGVGAWQRSDDQGLIGDVIEHARKFIDAVTPAIGPPRITGGTTNDPDTVLSLYWHIEQDQQLFGVYVRLKSNATWQLNWSGPLGFSGAIENIPVSDLSEASVTNIYREMNKMVRRNNSGR